MHHCLTETTDMNRIGPDINKQGLTKCTTDNTHQMTIISHLLHFLLQDLINLANIQSRSLDFMVANLKSQQDIYNEIIRANRDKAKNAMFAAIKTYDGTYRGIFEEWIDKLDQACRISGHDFRTKIIKKSIGAVYKVVSTSGDCSDDQLLANLRSCFSDAPTMNQAREELRNMRQREKESVMVYAYRWGRALVRSSAIHPEDERNPHIIKDFVSPLQKNIRNKIANKWTDLRNPPCTVKEAFNVATRIETQIQVANSFKMDLSSSSLALDISEINTFNTSCNELEINEVSKGNKWNSTYRKGGYSSNQNFSNKSQYNNKTQDNKSRNRWKHKERDSKITCLHESSHFIPAKCSECLFKQFDLAMKLRKEELKKQGKVEAEVSKVTEEDVARHLESQRTTCWRLQRSYRLKKIPKLQETLQHEYLLIMDSQNMVKVWTRVKRYYPFKQVVPKALCLK